MSIKVASTWLKGPRHFECQDKVNIRKGTLFVCKEENSNNIIESEYGLVVVCDGAGSKKYSAKGASTVVKAVETYFLSQYKWESFDDFDLSIIKQELFQYIKGQISDIIEQESSLADYACTLLFVLYIEQSKTYLYGHIGDGGIVSVEDEEPSILSAPENGEYKNQTYFITDTEAYQHFRLKSGKLIGEQVGFLVCTDGVSDSLFKYHEKKEHIKISPVCQTFCKWLIDAQTEEVACVEEAYKANLEKYFATRSKDDLSFGVLVASRVEE